MDYEGSGMDCSKQIAHEASMVLVTMLAAFRGVGSFLLLIKDGSRLNAIKLKLLLAIMSLH